MVTEDTVITDAIRALIGKEWPAVTYEVDKTTVRLFARAVGHTDPIYYDEAYARDMGYRSLVAPPGFLGYAIYDPRTADQPAGPPAIETRLTRRLNGGTEHEYFDDVCAGDVLTATMKISDIAEREGKVGPMLIVSTETTYKNKEGKTVCLLRGGFIRY